MFSLKPKKPYLFVFNLIILFELFSALAYFFPSLEIYFLAFFFVLSFILAFISLEKALLLALIELVIGSKGHLFSASIFNFNLSLRIVIFSAIILFSLFSLVSKSKRQDFFLKLKEFKYKWPILIFLLFYLLGLLNAYFSANSLANILADANAWIFLLYLIPVILVYFEQDRGLGKSKVDRLLKIFFLSVFFLSLKTLFILYSFSHNLYFLSDLYLHLRQSGVAEITLISGAWYRVFIQSQVFLAPAFFIYLFSLDFSKKTSYLSFKSIAILALFLSILIISLSRSFALAFLFSLSLALPILAYKNWQKFFRALLVIALALASSVLIIFITAKFPFPNPSQSSLREAIEDRLEKKEEGAAVSSRWALLNVLLGASLEKPLLGKGFGYELSYETKDPRALEQNPDGIYTSYAFEWAYLDTALKIGYLGLAAFLFLIFKILKDLFLFIRKREDTSKLILASFIGLIFFSVVNIFTPYLNHPLGLAFLLFSSCLIKKDTL